MVAKSSYRLHFQIHFIQRGDLKFSASRELLLIGSCAHIHQIEIMACHSVVALRLLRILFYTGNPAILMKSHHAETLMVGYLIVEDRNCARTAGNYPFSTSP